MNWGDLCNWQTCLKTSTTPKFAGLKTALLWLVLDNLSLDPPGRLLGGELCHISEGHQLHYLQGHWASYSGRVLHCPFGWRLLGLFRASFGLFRAGFFLTLIDSIPILYPLTDLLRPSWASLKTASSKVTLYIASLSLCLVELRWANGQENPWTYG